MLRCASPGACSEQSEEFPGLLRLKPHNHCGVRLCTPHSSGFARLAGACPGEGRGPLYEAVPSSRLFMTFYESALFRSTHNTQQHDPETDQTAEQGFHLPVLLPASVVERVAGNDGA